MATDAALVKFSHQNNRNKDRPQAVLDVSPGGGAQGLYPGVGTARRVRPPGGADVGQGLIGQTSWTHWPSARSRVSSPGWMTAPQRAQTWPAACNSLSLKSEASSSWDTGCFSCGP